MTVERGRDWGRAGTLPASGVLVTSDAEARAVVERARRAGAPVPVLGLLGGDLCRTLGGRGGDGSRLRAGPATVASCDLGSVVVGGDRHWFVAHAVARRSWWHGRLVAAMNAQWRGAWDVAPRAHPGDGLLDVLDGDPTIGDRWKARGRLPGGTHVPHPAIAVTRTAAMAIEFRRPLDIWLDGERVGRAGALDLRVEPDAVTVVV